VNRASTTSFSRRARRNERGAAEYVTMIVIAVVVFGLAFGLIKIATAGMTSQAMLEALERTGRNARSGLILARKRLQPDVQARINQAIYLANQPERRIDPRATFLDDLEFPVYEYDLEIPGAGNTDQDRVVTRTEIRQALPTRMPQMDPSGAKIPLGTDRNGPHTDLYTFEYVTRSTATSLLDAESVVEETGDIYALVAIDATTGDSYLAGAAGGLPGGLGDFGGIVEDFAFPNATAGGAPSPDAFGNRIEVVSMEEFGGSGGNKVYFYKIKGLAGAAGGNAEVTAVWDRSDAGLTPFTLRARVIVADHWRRAANYDPAADALRTTNPGGAPGTYRPGGGYYGLLVVEGPPPSAFFEQGSRQGYMRTELPIAWFDWQQNDLDDDLKRSLSITIHLAGIGDFPIASQAFKFNPMVSAPLAYDLEPGPTNPNFTDEWRVTGWTSFHVNLSGEYEGTAQGGLIEGPGGGTGIDQRFPQAPLEYTPPTPVGGPTLEGRVTQVATGGRVRTATVYTGDGQFTDFTNAAGSISPALDTYALGPNPLQRIGTNTTAKSFIFSLRPTLTFVRQGTNIVVDTPLSGNRPLQNVSTTQMPSGQSAAGGIIRPPTHLGVRASAVAVVPKAVYRPDPSSLGNGN
jgi:hypothetical protein